MLTSQVSNRLILNGNRDAHTVLCTFDSQRMLTHTQKDHTEFTAQLRWTDSLGSFKSQYNDSYLKCKIFLTPWMVGHSRK